MPSLAEDLTPALRSWYMARRDANLMGVCPLCDARLPAIFVSRIQRGSMVHVDTCPVTDPVWIAAYMAALA